MRCVVSDRSMSVYLAATLHSRKGQMIKQEDFVLVEMRHRQQCLAAANSAPRITGDLTSDACTAMAGEITDTGELYSPFVGLIYMFNLIVGTGALTMPKAFANAGWLISLILIIFLAFMSYMTTTFVVEAMAAANAQLRWKRWEKEVEADSSETLIMNLCPLMGMKILKSSLSFQCIVVACPTHMKSWNGWKWDRWLPCFLIKGALGSYCRARDVHCDGRVPAGTLSRITCSRAYFRWSAQTISLLCTPMMQLPGMSAQAEGQVASRQPGRSLPDTCVLFQCFIVRSWWSACYTDGNTSRKLSSELATDGARKDLTNQMS
ncbi:unnamed protein product [Ranitomeya imitator]|uniref:Amino acid transporter transmembrane domain-containing protein n=1 Tax=Ranitomeya imitator TaxID=111125 RepID=A0ABN9LE39_9NEOB|nr:unnamed protein product [Ranitomeya imitator]